MEEFERQDHGNHIFENEEVIDLYLRYSDKNKEIWEKRKPSISFDELLQKLESKPVKVYFQKRQPNEDSRKEKPRQRIIVPMGAGNERDLELLTELWVINNDWHTRYCLTIGAIKENGCFIPSENKTISRSCKIHFSPQGNECGTDNYSLIDEIDKLPVSTSDIDKTKDKEIWSKYVEALNQIIRQKERVWKIKKIENLSSQRVDIIIDEEELIEQFKVELKENLAGIKSCGIMENDGFLLEFDSYKELDEKEKSSVEDISSKYCFKLMNETPEYSISGVFKFKDVIEQLKKVVKGEYGINLDINTDREILNPIEDVPHISKIVSDNFKAIFKIVEDKRIKLKVDFENFKSEASFNELSFARTFKTGVDRSEKVKYDIEASVLEIVPDNLEEFQLIMNDIRLAYPQVNIEDKEYRKNTRIRFVEDPLDCNRKIIDSIISAVSPQIKCKGDYRSETSFVCPLANLEECGRVKESLKERVEHHQNVVSLTFDNAEGVSRYCFLRDEERQKDEDKKILENMKGETFKWLTDSQFEEYQNSLKKSHSFNDGKVIGTLERKTRNRFTLRLEEKSLGIKEMRDDIDAHEDYYMMPTFIGELANVRRMIAAMRKVTDPGTKNGYPVNRNLANFIFDSTDVRLPQADIVEEQERILKNLNESRLREQPKQLEAVAKAMLAPDMALIQGPPGTGKTTVIAEIIWQTLLRNPEAKILVTSQTNLAVDNALERLKGKKLVRPIRIGKEERFEEEGKVYSLDRLDKWYKAISKSSEEAKFSDNAVVEWIKNASRQCREEGPYGDIVKIWKSHLDDIDKPVKERFYQSYLDHVNVFAATCSECGSSNFRRMYDRFFNPEENETKERGFDIVILDEASKATPPELILPLTLGKKVVIIGDHKQLPPMIDENEFSEALEVMGAKELVEDWSKNDYKVSQFEKLFVKAPKDCVASLDTQFRMHGQIMDCISQFYKGQEQLPKGLLCGITEDMDNPDWNRKGSRWHGFELPPFIEPCVHAIWVNVRSNEERVGTSYKNVGEIDAIKKVLDVLINKTSGFKEYNEHFFKEEEKEIGVITFYMPQMQEIKRALYPNLDKSEWRQFESNKTKNEYEVPFRINTVDKFQGMERNIIIVSTVRSDLPNDPHYSWNRSFPFSLGFARETPRINVAFSRAKRLLIVIGNEKHFAQKPEYQNAIARMRRIDISQIENL